MSKETRAFQHYFKCLCFCQLFLFFHVINSLGDTVGFKLMELLRIWLNPTAPLGERIKGQILIFFCVPRSHQSPCFPPHSTCSPGPLLPFHGLDWLSQAFNWWAVGPLWGYCKMRTLLVCVLVKLSMLTNMCDNVKKHLDISELFWSNVFCSKKTKIELEK